MLRLRLAAVSISALVSSAVFLVHADAAADVQALMRAEVSIGTAASARHVATGGASDHVVLVADRDDDDANGKSDGAEEVLAPSARADLVAIDPQFVGAVLTPTSGGDRARILAGGKPVAWGQPLPKGAALQGVLPGHASIAVRAGARESVLAIDVLGVEMRDNKNAVVDMATMHASLERTPPTRVDLDDGEEVTDDPDALRVAVVSPEGTSVGKISLDSIASDGSSIDTLRDVPLAQVSCDKSAASSNARCLATAPIRLVVDDVDRAHSLVASRSLRAEVGGALVVREASGKKLQAIRVAGPRTSPIGPIGRHKLVVHPIVMRVAPGGAPAVGGTDVGAMASIHQEISLASATWGQCGITFGPQTQMDVKLVSPPPPYLVALGNDVGLPASGGEVRLRIDGKPLAFTTKKGWSTKQAALELQRKAEQAGVSATLSENARILPGAAPSVDVLMKKRTGQLSTVEFLSSSDATLGVSIGSVDLSDGLQHFGDTDSVAGTLEERTLVKAVEDGDPSTVEVIVVPFFSGGGRIGESFIGSDGSSMRNVVIIDRAGVRARRTSLTLAHELGHVILDEPGHPDDYGIDTPTRLMDSDASDSSPFGPRRLTLDECSRAIRQSGPNARIPLLTEWKLTAIPSR